MILTTVIELVVECGNIKAIADTGFMDWLHGWGDWVKACLNIFGRGLKSCVRNTISPVTITLVVIIKK